MRIYFSAAYWAVAILLIAWMAQLGWVEREAVDPMLMTLPMIAFITLLGGRDCRPAEREA